MIPLIAKYGIKKIKSAGIIAFGYPGTWASTFKEIERIIDVLTFGEKAQQQ